MDIVPQPEMISQSVQIQEQEPSVHETALMIAQTLGETEQAAHQQIQRIVWALGRTQSRHLLEQTLQIEQNGGIVLRDGSRRRTPGGVFFHLAFTTGQPKEGRQLERPVYKKPKQEKKTHQQTGVNQPVKQPQPAPALTWNDRIIAVREAETEKGNASVKITVIGRPGKIVDKGSCIVTVMESTKVPMLPKGLPTPTNVPTKYAVISHLSNGRRWKRPSGTQKIP
jgi:PHAX RNA-binding domain.